MLVWTRVEEPGFLVPDELLASLDAGDTPMLEMRFANGHVLRATVEQRDGQHRIPFEKATLTATSLVMGDPVEVDVTLATSTRA